MNEMMLDRMREAAAADMKRARAAGWFSQCPQHQSEAGAEARRRQAQAAKQALFDATTRDWQMVSDIVAMVPADRQQVGAEMARRYLLELWEAGRVERRHDGRGKPALYRRKREALA